MADMKDDKKTRTILIEIGANMRIDCRAQLVAVNVLLLALVEKDQNRVSVSKITIYEVILKNIGL